MGLFESLFSDDERPPTITYQLISQSQADRVLRGLIGAATQLYTFAGVSCRVGRPLGQLSYHSVAASVIFGGETNLADFG